MNKKQVSNLIDEHEFETQSLLHDILKNFKHNTGHLWDFKEFICVVEKEAENQLKIGNSQASTELHIFLESISVKD